MTFLEILSVDSRNILLQKNISFRYMNILNPNSTRNGYDLTQMYIHMFGFYIKFWPVCFDDILRNKPRMDNFQEISVGSFMKYFYTENWNCSFNTRESHWRWNKSKRKCSIHNSLKNIRFGNTKSQSILAKTLWYIIII